MKFKKPKNENYAAVVAKVSNTVHLENMDNVHASIVLGNQVITSKDVNVGDVGIYFPVECQLSQNYMAANNLYRDSKMNSDTSVSGYFDQNGRVRCIKLAKKHKSEGLFMPLESITNLFLNLDLDDIDFKEGDTFDEIEGVNICKKYYPPKQKTYNSSGENGKKRNKSKKPKEDRLIDNQFRFHSDTGMLYKNMHMIGRDDIISITYKIHGTSFISSKVLCKKKLNMVEKILKKIGIKIVDTQYDYVFSSRKVIKNKEFNENPSHFYKEDIWATAHNEVKDFLLDGMTVYGEIAGYLSNSSMIQKDYDYGCEVGEHKVFIYRITYTNPSGHTFEFSAKQVQDWCKSRGLNPVPQLFYGYAKELTDDRLNDENWRSSLLENLKSLYNEKNCFMCKSEVPEEGCVVRIEGTGIEAFKLKSNRFYERETIMLDKGETNIEDENSIDNDDSSES